MTTAIDPGWRADLARGHEDFVFFWKGPFSQWSESFFTVQGVEYNTAEQFMMAEKARLFGDSETLKLILGVTSPHKQKAYGRQVANFDPTIWMQNAKLIVYRGSHAKFTQSQPHKDALEETFGKTLVDASPVDTIWGIGLAEDDPLALQRETWKGANLLGEIITTVRKDVYGR